MTPTRSAEQTPPPDDEVFRRLVESVRDYAIFMLRPDGRIASWNSGAQLIKQYAAAEAVGRHFSMFYEPEAVAAGWPEEELRRSLAQGRFEDEGWRVRKDGTRFWANVIISPLFDGTGGLLGYSKVTRDLSERRLHEEQLRQSEERLRLIVDGVKDHAMFLLDAQGIVVSWNPAAGKLLGYAPEAMVGRDATILYPREEQAAGRPQGEMSAAEHAGSFHSEGWKVKADGTRFWAEVSISAVRDGAGHPGGFVHILRDLTEQRRIEELEAEGRRVLEFIAMLSHELRNPLAPIKSAVRLLKTAQGQQQSAKYADMIGRQVTHLTRLVDDLLDVSRITTGKIELERVAVDLNSLVLLAAESMRSTVAAREHALDVQLAPEPVFVDGDAVRLTQVVVNLLGNAVKYTPRQGRIRLVVSRDPATARVEVSDNGIGMAESLLRRAFDPFVQGERTVDRAQGGLGIGLTLVKRIVDLHGGSVVASSRGADTGTRLTVTLPLAAGPLPAVAAEGSASASGSGQILVVDDNQDAADSLAELLRAAGHEVWVAYSGEQALEIAAGRSLVAILLDIGLPDMSGYEVARRLRLLPSARHVRLIATTGYGLLSDIESSTLAGFDAHLVKPVDHDEVLRLIG